MPSINSRLFPHWSQLLINCDLKLCIFWNSLPCIHSPSFMLFFSSLFSSFFGLVLNLCDWLFSVSGTALCQICTTHLSLLNPTSKYRDAPSVPNSNSSTRHLHISISCWSFFLIGGNSVESKTHEIKQTLLYVIDYFVFVSSFAHNQIFYYIPYLFWCPQRGPSLSFFSLAHLCISLYKGRNWIEQKIEKKLRRWGYFLLSFKTNLIE